MIPFVYRLRKGVRVEKDGDTFLVVSERPLRVIRVRPQAARILRLCDGQRNLTEIAARVHGTEEERVYALCDYFRKKGLLEMVEAGNGGYFPFVTVIIPARDREAELRGCLDSVFSQDYPGGRMEVIVIDDGSRDGTGDAAARFPCRLLSHGQSRGQSHCRNLGAREARGEILAFLDSDCVAGERWLREMVTYFQWARVGAVGGYVDGYFEESPLDRYERAFSSLNMGRQVLCGAADDSTLYTPTCNLLVRRAVYWETGGIREDLHVGEDVDFCWRMRGRGFHLLYVPFGRVRHKHRNRLSKMLKRRADYGTSEAVLYRLHPEKKKVFQVPPPAAAAFLAVCTAMLFRTPLPLCAAGVCLAGEACSKAVKINRLGLGLARGRVLASVARSYFSCAYFISFHVVRYYLAPLLLLGFLFHPVWLLGGFLVGVSSSVDYAIKRPRLGFPAFLFYYVLEHLSYQTGVLAGCLRARSFGSYKVRLVRR